jgi:hypothetical protein
MAAICAGAAAGEAGDRVPQHPARADGIVRVRGRVVADALVEVLAAVKRAL